MTEPSHHVSFDVNTTASDFLTMVPHEWDHPCLTSPAFDTLAADYANDQARNAFKPLAALIDEDGLELWQIDFFEDTVHVALVPAAQVDAFRAYWTKGVLKEPPDDLAIDRSTAFLRSPYGDHPDNGKYFNFSTRPPVKLPLPGFDDDRAFAKSWDAAYQSGTRNIWRCRDLERKEEYWFRLAQIDDIGTWSPRCLGGAARLPGDHPELKPMGDAFVYAWEGGNETDSEVWWVTRDSAVCWYRSTSKLQVFPFPDAMRCVIVEGDSRFAIADGPVTQAHFHRIPKPFYDTGTGIVAPSGNRMVYFTGTKTRLRMHRVNTDNMSTQSCVLEHFGHADRHDGKAYRTFGNLEVRAGHADWFILNHRTNQFGKIDTALMWNSVTDDTFVIEQGDIPLRQPTIVYQRALGRYLALQSDRVALLPDFDTIRAGKRIVTLQWEAGS